MMAVAVPMLMCIHHAHEPSCILVPIVAVISSITANVDKTIMAEENCSPAEVILISRKKEAATERLTLPWGRESFAACQLLRRFIIGTACWLSFARHIGSSQIR